MIEKIKDLSSSYHKEITAIRRHLHQHPELSFNEFQTCSYVEEQLQTIGITNKKRIAKTGIVAIIEGKNPSKKTIALRGDMDALPIQETNDVPYKSQNAGVMHAMQLFFWKDFFLLLLQRCRFLQFVFCW